MIIYGENAKFIPGMFSTFPRERFKSVSWELSGKYQGIISLFGEILESSEKSENYSLVFSTDTDLNISLGSVENIPGINFTFSP